jgi:hypothetical protein
VERLSLAGHDEVLGKPVFHRLPGAVVDRPTTGFYTRSVTIGVRANPY